VVEIWPGAGWYTEILAPYLRENGKLYAAHFEPESDSEYFRNSRQRFEEKLAAAPQLYDRVELAAFTPAKPLNAVPDGVADGVVTFRNVHNWYMRGGGEERVVSAFQQFHRMLKPGGVLGVVDHRLAGDRPLQDQEASGYMSEALIIRAAEQAGFRLEAKSEVNANPLDHTNHAKGVWTLPPGLAEGEVNREAYLKIGESDRMTLKFVKPATSTRQPGN
jgi:predicted methyltransferase